MSRLMNGTKLVSKMYQPNGLSTGQREFQFNYRNAIFNREGKGFLGMAYWDRIDVNANRKVLSGAGYNEDFASMVPTGNYNLAWNTGETINSSIPIYEFKSHASNSTRYHFNIDQSDTYDAVKGRSYRTLYDYTPGFENVDVSTLHAYQNIYKTLTTNVIV